MSASAGPLYEVLCIIAVCLIVLIHIGLIFMRAAVEAHKEEARKAGRPTTTDQPPRDC